MKCPVCDYISNIQMVSNMKISKPVFLSAEVANNMMTMNNVGNMPNIAAGLRALSQLGPVMPMQQQQQQQIPPPDDDHGPAMVTGMQGVAFSGLPVRISQ